MIYRRAFFKGEMSNKVIMESEFSVANDTTRDLIPSPSLGHPPTKNTARDGFQFIAYSTLYVI